MLVAQVRLLFSTCFLNSELRLLFHSLDFSDSGMEGKLGHKWQDMANGEFPLFVLGTFFNFSNVVMSYLHHSILTRGIMLEYQFIPIMSKEYHFANYT